MRLAISNIAWLPEESEVIAQILVDHGVRSVEIAPTTYFADPSQTTLAAREVCREFWASRGIEIVAFQALLYGRDDLTIFEAEGRRRSTIDYLKAVMDLAAALGTSVLVFGSPKNRRVGECSVDEVRRIEREFFGEIGRYASDRNLVFCIEPNPRVYGCDYLNTSREVLSMLDRLGSSGLGLHLDAAGMTLAGEGPEALQDIESERIRHFHISEPNLAPIGSGGVDHSAFSSALRRIGYRNHVSIEMRPDRETEGINAKRVASSLRYALEAYEVT